VQAGVRRPLFLLLTVLLRHDDGVQSFKNANGGQFSDHDEDGYRDGRVGRGDCSPPPLTEPD